MSVMFLDCPAYMDDDGAARCGLPVAVQYRYVVESTGGPLENAKIRCPRGHWFNGPVEFLTWDKDQAATALAEYATRLRGSPSSTTASREAPPTTSARTRWPSSAWPGKGESRKASQPDVRALRRGRE